MRRLCQNTNTVVRFKILIVTTTIALFWDVTPCSQIGVYQCFKGSCSTVLLNVSNCYHTTRSHTTEDGIFINTDTASHFTKPTDQMMNNILLIVKSLKFIQINSKGVPRQAEVAQGVPVG